MGVQHVPLAFKIWASRVFTIYLWPLKFELHGVCHVPLAFKIWASRCLPCTFGILNFTGVHHAPLTFCASRVFTIHRWHFDRTGVHHITFAFWASRVFTVHLWPFELHGCSPFTFGLLGAIPYKSPLTICSAEREKSETRITASVLKQDPNTSTVQKNVYLLWHRFTL